MKAMQRVGTDLEARLADRSPHAVKGEGRDSSSVGMM